MFTYNPLNIELCSTTAKELAQFTFQLYHYSLKLALYQSTSPHATLHAEIYKPTFKTLTGSSNVSESWKETMRKSKENSSANAIKWRQSAEHVEWAFRTGAHALSGLSRQVSAYRLAIIQFRRYVYKYSTKKTPPITSISKVGNTNRL